MRLRRHVAQRERAEHAADRLQHRRHHVLDALAPGRQQRRHAVEEQRQPEKIEQPIHEPEPGERVGDCEVEDPPEEHVAADEERELLHGPEGHRRLQCLGAGHAPRRLERRDRHRILHQAAAHHERERHRNQQERGEDGELPRLGEDARRQPAALVHQQRQHRPRREPEQPAGDAAAQDAHEERAAHEIAGDPPQPHQAERAALVEHQQSREVRSEHPRHPQERQRDEQRHQANQLRDALHPLEQHLGRAVDDEGHAAAELRFLRRLAGFVAVARHRLLQRALRNRRVLFRVAVEPRVQRFHVRERSRNVPPRHEARAIDAREVDDLGRVLRHLNVSGILIRDADDVGRHEPRGDLIELRQDVPLVRHQQDRADVGHVADRAGLVHQPAIQLVAIEPDDLVDRRAEQEARLILHVDLQREVARSLQRKERLAHRVLGTDERQHGAASGAARAAGLW